MFNRKRKTQIKNRLISLVSLLLLVLILLSMRVYYIQKKYSTRETGSFKGNHKQYEQISDYNYSLLDRNGKSIFQYDIKYKVVIDTMAFKLNNLNQNLENIMAFNYIMKSEDKDFSFDAVVKNGGKLYYDVSKENFDKINSLKNIKGIYTYVAQEKKKDESWKIENMLTSTKGFALVENENKRVETKEIDKEEKSLEMIIEKELENNKDPKIVFERDHDGLYGEEEYDIPESNLNVKLTLDSEMQKIVRDVLSKEEYKTFQNAGAVLIDSASGEVLALAQKNEGSPNVVLGSGSISGYEAGSIFKILTLEAAMELKGISLSDELRCEGLVCKKEKIHGTISVKEAFEVSCNDVFSKLGAEIGTKELLDFAKKQGIFSSVLGLDEKTGMETRGAVPENVSITNLSIGQSMQTSLIQMAGIIAPVVNEGEYVQPYILKGFENQKGKMVKEFTELRKNVISKETANNLKSVMNSTVGEGTAIVTQIEGIEVGAKTGTAEALGEELHGWFLGYFKHEGKYYTLGVMVPNIKNVYEDRKPGGGNTAGPIFRDIVLELTKK
ncbi:penicillin-binding transpeptidase domain-containing protein [Clostridium sp. LIBA-8841]|uniref:penicillin-binding transpeptidase domain-containing protein n=1 Tax=Clostridium sp. LIBA-8841 TaxID=2987530 RepID=UPI002AC723B1|nr:penicillin-binding transpeptidase domain-containing protein [Clostridium sp. LIBA-8841]MDZ5252699.1 penicillin-binding transpeptidase domain-containing protein [Clostridium sp. LIBA-8841]